MKMKLHILSDLHNEFLRHRSPVDGHAWTGSLPETEADLIILAGDIDTGTNGIEWMLKESVRLSKPMLYVLGNHEFYREEYYALKQSIAGRCHGTDVHLLDCGEYRCGEVRFLGLTLWTDYCANPAVPQDLAMYHAGRSLADHALIDFMDGSKQRGFAPADALALHRAELQWLQNRLCESFNGRTVIVTHHAPHPVCDHPQHPNSPIGGAFYSNLEALIANHDIALWVYGHTHANLDTEIYGTRIVSNQAGYPGEKVAGFDPGMIVVV